MIFKKIESDGKKQGQEFVVLGFSPEELEIHYVKHRNEFYPSLSKAEYNERARKLLNSKIGGNIEGFTDDKGRIWRYNTETHDFGKCNPDGVIITFFKADKPQYWEKQVDLYEP